MKGANEKIIAETINSFSGKRQSDLWSGVGLAAAYAGGVSESRLLILANRAEKYLPSLAQGVAFAAEAREQGGNQCEHTSLASRTICQGEPSAVAKLTRDARKGLGQNQSGEAYMVWRKRIQEHFETHS